MNEELDSCRCLSENLKWIICNLEALIELFSHCIKIMGVSRRWGVGVGCESNSTIAID